MFSDWNRHIINKTQTILTWYFLKSWMSLFIQDTAPAERLPIIKHLEIPVLAHPVQFTSFIYGHTYKFQTCSHVVFYLLLTAVHLGLYHLPDAQIWSHNLCLSRVTLSHQCTLLQLIYCQYESTALCNISLSLQEECKTPSFAVK